MSIGILMTEILITGNKLPGLRVRIWETKLDSHLAWKPEKYILISAEDPWHFGADPYLWLMDPFFSDFKDTKKNSYFFLKLARRHTISSLKNLIYCKNFVLKFFFYQHYFSPLNTFMGKGKDSEPDPDPYPLTYRSGAGKPKNMQIWFRIRIPNTDIDNKKCNKSRY